MTERRYKFAIGLLCGILALLILQNALLWRGIGRLERSIESADASAIDALEVAKEIRAQQIPAANEGARSEFLLTRSR